MVHFPKPFFRPSRNTRYVRLDGKQLDFGQDKTKAFRRHHDLMRDVRPTHGCCETLIDLIDEFPGRAGNRDWTAPSCRWRGER